MEVHPSKRIVGPLMTQRIEALRIAAEADTCGVVTFSPDGTCTVQAHSGRTVMRQGTRIPVHNSTHLAAAAEGSLFGSADYREIKGFSRPLDLLCISYGFHAGCIVPLTLGMSTVAAVMLHTFTPGWDYQAGVRSVAEVADDLVMELTHGPDDSVSSRLLICNDDSLTAAGIARIGESVLNVQSSVIRSTISELIEFVESPSDLLVSDVFVAGKRIDHQVRELGAASRIARVLVVASRDTAANRLAAARAGTSGYCDREAGLEAIAEVLVRVGSGQHLPPVIEEDTDLGRCLTARENDVLRLLDRGLQVKEVASELAIAQSTVRWYVRSMFEKLDVHSTTAALFEARKSGVLTDTASGSSARER